MTSLLDRKKFRFPGKDTATNKMKSTVWPKI